MLESQQGQECTKTTLCPSKSGFNEELRHPLHAEQT